MAFLVVVIAALGYLAYQIFQPFAAFLMAAALLAFMLHPLHLRLEPYVGSRVSALVLVVFTISVAVAPLLIVGYLLLDAIEGSLQNIDQIAIIERFESIIEDITGTDVDLWAEIETFLEAFTDAALGQVTQVLSASIHVVVGLLLLVFVLYYLILDGRRLVAWLIEVTPMDDDLQEELFTEAHLITWAVIKSHLFVAVFEGVLLGLAFFAAGIPNPAFWTVVMVILAILPIIGAFAVWAPAVAYLVFQGAFGAAGFLFVYGAIMLNLDHYLRAFLVDRDTDLHPAVVLIGVLGGLYVFGVLGLFIGPIVLAVFKATVNVFGRQYGEQAVPTS